jgi:predicted negative regulator of RcsB-dependent stress response
MDFAKLIEKQWKLILSAFATILVLGAVLVFVSYKGTQKEKAAQESYFAVEKKLIDLKSKKAAPPAKDQKTEVVDFSQVKTELEKVMNGYPGTIACQMAGLHLAHLLLEEKNFDLALSTLQKVENKDKGLVNTLVQQQMGQLLADKEKCQDAITIWQKIVDRKEASFIHNETKIQQALCYTKLNNLVKAEEILTKLANLPPSAEMGNVNTTSKEAEKYLRLIQFKKASGT